MSELIIIFTGEIMNPFVSAKYDKEYSNRIKAEQKNNKALKPDACECEYREYWVGQKANFCGECGGSLRTA